MSDSVVHRQRPAAHLQEDQGAHSRLQEVERWHTHTHPYKWCSGGLCHQLQITGDPQLQRSLLDNQKLQPGQQGSPAPFRPSTRAPRTAVLQPGMKNALCGTGKHCRVVKTAQHIIGASFPKIEDIYEKHCLSRAHNITKDFSHLPIGCVPSCPLGGATGVYKPKQAG